MNEEARASRALMLAFAVVFLFETWIWGSVVAAVGWLAQRIPWKQFKTAVRRQVNRLPAIVALLLFGVPLLVNEFGSLACLIMMATGHFVVGAVGYTLIKVVGLSLLAVIFDLTREKLMTLRWFVVGHEKFEAVHDFARRLVAPYRLTAQAFLREFRHRARAYWARLEARARGEPG